MLSASLATQRDCSPLLERYWLVFGKCTTRIGPHAEAFFVQKADRADSAPSSRLPIFLQCPRPKLCKSDRRALADLPEDSTSRGIILAFRHSSALSIMNSSFFRRVADIFAGFSVFRKRYT